MTLFLSPLPFTSFSHIFGLSDLHRCIVSPYNSFTLLVTYFFFFKDSDGQTLSMVG